MEKYSKTLTPKTSGVWNADETLVLTKRGKDNKNPNLEFDYVWNVMDNKTKFLPLFFPRSNPRVFLLAIESPLSSV
jgi:hypothetical protein